MKFQKGLREGRDGGGWKIGFGLVWTSFDPIRYCSVASAASASGSLGKREAETRSNGRSSCV